jgi:tetratricopeptide (TPR) repeat protein
MSFPRVTARHLVRRVSALALTLALGAAAGCGEKPPLEQAQELFAKGKTAEAVQLLTKLHEQDPNAYQPIVLLGQAAEAREDWDAMAKWYEAALALPESKRQTKLLQGELHAALVAQARKKSGFPDQYEALLKKAADFEAELKLDETPANDSLFKLYKVAFESARKGERWADALEVVEDMSGLYYSQSELREYTQQRKELQRRAFFQQVRGVFEGDLKDSLVKTGRFDTPNNAITLSYTFTVPDPQEDGLFSPTAEDFVRQVQYAACWGGLREEYARVLNPWAKASPLGAELREEHLNSFFNRAMQGKEPTWVGDIAFDPAGAHKTSAAGLQMSCAGSLPVDFVIENFRKIRLFLDKEAREGRAPAGAEKAAPAPAGGEESADEPAADEPAADGEKAAP